MHMCGMLPNHVSLYGCILQTYLDKGFGLTSNLLSQACLTGLLTMSHSPNVHTAL